LSSVVAGGTPLPKAVGRATAQVTQVAPLDSPVAAAAPVIQTKAPTLEQAVADERSPGTSIGGTSGIELPRSRAPWLALLLLLLLAGGGVAVYVATRSHPVAVVHDAALPDARLAVDAARPDAAVDAAVPDAAVAVPIDAPAHRHVDAAPKPDAAVVAIDAAVVVQPAGSGFVTIGFKNGKFANGTLDGKAVTLPLMHEKIAAGTHTVVFSDPASGKVIDTQTFTIADGQSLSVMQR
jgi:hypothetical protein